MLKHIVNSGRVPGLLAYAAERPVGWCAVEPRELYPRLGNSRILAPVDEQRVWSITCLFIDKSFRRQGVSTELLRAAVKHVKKNRGRIVEGYPTDTTGKQPDAFVWTGIASAYIAAGFKEVARRSRTRPIMRFYLSG